ncbi:MAG: F0F1 ATP synthase subunit B [Nitrospirae bacterium]|nr:F0F1 ATP synthase subunit B [Nitrospirota bacterium]
MNLEIQQILTQAFGFIILLFLLKKFAWKPLLSLLDERRDKIASEFNTIERVKSEIARLEEDYKSKLADIDNHSRQKIQEAISEGQRIAAEIQDKAREDANKAIEKAKANIEIEVAKARMELRSQMANIAIKAAEKILKEDLDDSRHKNLVMGFIENLESVK